MGTVGSTGGVGSVIVGTAGVTGVCLTIHLSLRCFGKFFFDLVARCTEVGGVFGLAGAGGSDGGVATGTLVASFFSPTRENSLRNSVPWLSVVKTRSFLSSLADGTYFLRN